MKKLGLRMEHLVDLEPDEMRLLAGAAPRMAGTTVCVSEGDCSISENGCNVIVTVITIIATPTAEFVNCDA